MRIIDTTWGQVVGWVLGISFILIVAVMGWAVIMGIWTDGYNQGQTDEAMSDLVLQPHIFPNLFYGTHCEHTVVPGEPDPCLSKPIQTN